MGHAAHLVALAALGACGGDAPRCPPLEPIRARLAQAPAYVEPTVPVVRKADGLGRIDGAHRVRFDATGSPAFEAILAEVDGAAPRVVEVEAPATARLVPLQLLLAKLSARAEVRLVVEVLEPLPPPAGVPAWVVTEADRIAEAGADGPYEIAALLRRVAGSRCADELDRRLAAAQQGQSLRFDDDVVRTALPDALEACRCQGAQVVAVAWLFEKIAYTRRHPGWLRVQVDDRGEHLPGVHDTFAFVRALERLPIESRAAGVWPVP